MECRDRYFMITADLSFTGEEPSFEAVDGTGVYPITELYAAECGYSISVLPLPGHVELRASYFSCHVDNKDDKVFMFNFNLITHDEVKGKVTYALNKTCSPSLPWSPREVTCEVNYMEVSVKGDMACPSATKMDDWNTALKTAYTTASSDWQVMFQKAGQQLSPMTLSEARKQNYMFDVTDGRLVFRTPYGQPDSFTTMVDDVPVEVVHPTLFSRQTWIVLMVDLVAACSMHEGSYDGSHLVWETPEVLHPLAYGLSGLESSQVNMGVSGGLLEQPIAEKGYIMEKHGAKVQISIPYNAEGGYRKSFVADNLYHEFYIFHLYLEQMFYDEDHVDTRLRLFRQLATPMLSRPAFTSNRTILEERMFTVCLGDVPEDVDLVSIQLNGQDFAVPLINASSLAISKVLQPNYTHGYTLRVPFDNAVVLTQLSKDGILQHTLDINYTLAILPENEAYYHLASVVALITDVFPPSFEAVCSENGISFKRDHQPYDYLWQVYIGPEPLTAELAAEKGYTMHNDSQSLLLYVPLFTDGYTYKDIGLKTFFGTFNILIQDPKTLEVQGSSVKTCPFTTAELIVCSTDGKVAVVVDVSMAIPSGGIPARMSLQDRHCGPKEADNTRVRFSFALNSCGTRVKLGKDYVTYENEILFNQKHLTVKKPLVARDATEKVTFKCTYSLAGLHRLFSVHRFESDTPGVGRIMREKIPMEGIQQQTQVLTINQKLQYPTIRPMTSLQTVSTTRRPFNKLPAYQPPAQTVSVSTTRRPSNKLPASHPPAQYIRVFSFLKNFTDLSKKAVKKMKKSSHRAGGAVHLCSTCWTGYILPSDLHPRCEACLGAVHARGTAAAGGRLHGTPGGGDGSWADRGTVSPDDELDKILCGNDFPNIPEEILDGGHESAGSAPSISGSPPDSPVSLSGDLEPDLEGGAPQLRLSPSPPRQGAPLLWSSPSPLQSASHMPAAKGLLLDLPDIIKQGGIAMPAEQPAPAHGLLGGDVYVQEPPVKRPPLWLSFMFPPVPAS
uniref:zona pellucida protein AX 4 n=1 Tax=Centroberyx gerrardi TaxID=166262 RepID=UPI003AB0AA8A